MSSGWSVEGLLVQPPKKECVSRSAQTESRAVFRCFLFMTDTVPTTPKALNGSEPPDPQKTNRHFPPLFHRNSEVQSPHLDGIALIWLEISMHDSGGVDGGEGFGDLP